MVLEPAEPKLGDSKPFVLDTSALLTLIEDEDGADRVEQVLRTRRILLPWVVLMEVYYITHQECGVAAADLRYAAINKLSAEILTDVTEPVLLAAARLKATYRVSFADSIVAAFALHNEATLLHKDPELEALAGQLELEALPYKKER